MSSTPKGAPKKAGPAPEKKAAAGPVITPQVLAIFFGIILLIGVIVYYQMVVAKFKTDMQQLSSQINTEQQHIQTYKKKAAKLEEAQDINVALRQKLSSLDYLFLEDQSSVVPFFENTIFPMIDSSRLVPAKITPEEYEFKINMAMQPFKTLPSTRLFDSAYDLFPISYDGEKNGVPEDTPLNTQPNEFLTPYTITFEEFRGTYEDAMDFVEKLQLSRDKELITVHCLKNNDGDNFGIFRTSTTWNIVITVYFLNPEMTASGENPPGPPGSKSC